MRAACIRTMSVGIKNVQGNFYSQYLNNGYEDNVDVLLKHSIMSYVGDVVHHGDDILIRAIILGKTLSDGSQLLKAQALIQRDGRGIGSNHRIELEDAKAMEGKLGQAVLHQEPAHALSPACLAYRVGSVGDVAYPPNVVGMENIQTKYCLLFNGNCTEGLGCKELLS